VFKDDEFPVGGSARSRKRRYVINDFMKIRSAAVNRMGVSQAVQAEDHAAVMKKRAQSLPPGRILQGAVGIAAQSDGRVKLLHIFGDIHKFGIGAQIAKISGKGNQFKLPDERDRQQLEFGKGDEMPAIGPHLLLPAAEGAFADAFR